ncbi:hypothetical protein PNO31109_02874 [Pandoraea nosoerga]|uniref:Uncharacterized protein n=1 Tax=Pandoraea nosoerga TaxID=2508296 RepID=A0A5E4VUL9_9BURK|nr:hypothetical protein PNO31109_02874 [Pandoraea nosoerga]
MSAPAAGAPEGGRRAANAQGETGTIADFARRYRRAVPAPRTA